MSPRVDRPRSDPARSFGWVPDVAFGLGVIGLAATITLQLKLSGVVDITAASLVPGLVCAAVVRRRRPALTISGLFLLSSGLGALGGLASVLTANLIAGGPPPSLLAWINLLLLELFLVTAIVMFYGVAFFPDGRPETSRETLIAVFLPALLLLPVFVSLSTPIVPVQRFLQAPATPNPLHLFPFQLSYVVGQTIIGLVWLSLLAAPLVLLVRYLRSDLDIRRRIRWLLPPFVLLGMVIVGNLILPDGGGVVGWLSLLAAQALLPVGFTIGVFDPRILDVDRVLRHTLVYGALWLTIAVIYVGIAAAVGLTAGRYLSVQWAVVAALFAATLFQPARSYLERLADRWVFGNRVDPTLVISELGATLSETPDLAELLPRMARALEDGLGLEWARVRLRGSPASPTGPAAELSVPIILDGEELGKVECGPKTAGPWTPEDRTVVATFGAQASLAVRNVLLTEDLASHAAELAASRMRLVESQEAERRRIERNIHDGVQQELVALIGQIGLVRHRLARRAAPPLEALLEEISTLQAGLQELLDNLRALASGVHPTVLTDHGLVAAIDALATRHPVPVRLQIDPMLKGVRMQEAVEGAAYFVVAESLANSLKYASATELSIELTRLNGSLLASITDDGVGFDPPPPRDGGLASLDERLRALGGELSVTSVRGGGTTVLARLDLLTGSGP